MLYIQFCTPFLGNQNPIEMKNNKIKRIGAIYHYCLQYFKFGLETTGITREHIQSSAKTITIYDCMVDASTRARFDLRT